MELRIAGRGSQANASREEGPDVAGDGTVPLRPFLAGWKGVSVKSNLLSVQSVIRKLQKIMASSILYYMCYQLKNVQKNCLKMKLFEEV